MKDCQKPATCVPGWVKSLLGTHPQRDDRELNRLVQSIGMACFVKYYKDFADFSRSDSIVVQKIREAEGYTECACATRVLKSRQIIRSGRARDALKRIAQSSRVPAQVANTASQLLSQGV